ncbi:MAG TPA: SIMPL domain-containing protein [Candidatus Limnocylindria bacterium]|jgi:hypothetical protein|nr:SIMPL domain-containing protein [Candidatus Limnocylindria bacterium]
MFTPFQKTLLALVAVGFVAIGIVTWARGSMTAAPAVAVASEPARPAPVLSQSAPPPGIIATGEASVRAAPGEAYLAFAVQAGGPVGTDVAGQLQTRVERLLAKARALGVQDVDIVLGPLQFQPQFTYDPGKGGQKVIAFNAYQQIAIECDEIDGMPALISELMRDDATSALSVRYSPSTAGPAYRIAREKAIADARAQAEVTAAAAGLKLGPAISITDLRPQPSPYGGALTTGKFPLVGGPGFPPAEIDTYIRVQVQYSVVPLS